MSHRVLPVAAGASLGVAVALRSASRIPVFEGSSETAEPWLITSIPSLGWIFVAVVIGAIFGTWLPPRASKPCLFAGMAASAIFVPGVFDAAPFVAAFSGRFLDFVLLACVLAAGWRLIGEPGATTANRAGVVATCVFLAMGLKMWADVGLSGDEPHYVLVTHSIVEDGDLEVLNNYLAEDYELFYLGKIGPHLARDTPYSVHGIGLPILLVPGYAAFGIYGVIVTLALLGGLVVHGLFRLCGQLGMSSEATTLTIVAFALTSPALFLSVSAYPELPAAAVAVFTALQLASPRASSRDWHATLGFSLLAGTLPFFHVKFLPLAGVLWLSLAYRLRSKRARIAILSGACLSAVALMAFFYVTTGSLDPTASYGRQRIFVSAIPVGMLGLLFDQEFGLLVYAPWYLAGLVGWVALLRRDAFFGTVAALVVAAVALPGAAHPLWSGGSSSPARFLFPALPLIALGVGSLWSWERRDGISPWIPVLVILSLSISVFTVFLPGQPLYLNARDGTGRLWEELSSSWDLTSYLPSIVQLDTRSLVLASLGVGGVILAIALQARRRPVRLPAFPLLLLAAAWAQDLSGISQPRRREGRWVSGFMRQVADRQPNRFLTLPDFGFLEREDVMERVSLPLSPLRPDGDPRHWWSLPYSIPAGRYRVGGILPEGWAPCNDFACFEVADAHFTSDVALTRFRVRARRLRESPRLHFDDLLGNRPRAIRSLSLPGRRRLHGLDDGAYLDRKGFWVKREARARFAIEPGGVLRLANGGRDNTVRVYLASGTEQFELAPWAEATFVVPPEDGVSTFSVESERGFRPSALDPEDPDYRDLGVFVGAPRF